MEEEASRNKKNIATLNSETILTERLGCFARTLAASSCTEREMAMRFAMSMSNPTNAASPDSVVDRNLPGLAARLPSQPLVRNSLKPTRNVLGSAVMTIDSISTDATSSSSDICASCAASSSSRPMPNDTENARSEPSEPRAAAVSDMAPDADNNAGLIRYEAVEDAMEAHHLPCRLAWQVPEQGGSTLVLRRLLVAPRGVKRGHSSGGPVRAVRGRMAYNAQLYSSGSVFGCTLGNCMQHARAGKYSLHNAMMALKRVVAPASRALGLCSGEDCDFLTRGMACHRVIKAQARRFHELKRCPKIDSKTGHVGMVLGATVAILASFECMIMDRHDTPGLDRQLSACLRDAHAVVNRWRMPAGVFDEDMQDARAAEARALERARLGVARAQTLSSDLTPHEGMRLQLDFYRRAVWPQGECLSNASHADLLLRIRSGELVDLERDERAQGAVAPGVGSLSALSLKPREPDLDAEHASVSLSTNSTYSSWSSMTSSVGENMGNCAVPLFYPALDALTVRGLSAAARAVLSREQLISSQLNQDPT